VVQLVQRLPATEEQFDQFRLMYQALVMRSRREFFQQWFDSQQIRKRVKFMPVGRDSGP